MLEFLKKFEHYITRILTVLMAMVVILAVIELAWYIVKDVFTPPYFLLDLHELLDIFGLFLLVLIGLELLDTIKNYIKLNVIHVEVVVLVAIIAIARKVIILDLKDVSSQTLLGIAAIIIALAVAYYFLKRGICGEGQTGK